MMIDESGKTYGRLTVIAAGPSDNAATWKCRCVCGNEKIVKGGELRRGSTSSCGCLRTEVSSKFFTELGRRQGPRNRLTESELQRRMSEPRQCSRCKTVKGADAFGPFRSVSTGVQGKRTTCKACHAQGVYKWKAAHPEDAKAMIRRCALVRLYGITMDDYDEMLTQQKGLCKICNRPSTPRRKGVLDIDHCHKTKAVRGLLCHNCNVMIGLAQDDPAILREAALYIERSRLSRIET